VSSGIIELLLQYAKLKVILLVHISNIYQYMATFQSFGKIVELVSERGFTFKQRKKVIYGRVVALGHISVILYVIKVTAKNI